MIRGSMRVFTPRDFLDLGARTAVDKALSRLVRAGRVRRVGRGLYDIPRSSALLAGAAPADVDAVLGAVGRRLQVKIAPDHAAAANAMGLTTAVPVRPSYVTSRRVPSVKLGDWTIHLKPAGAALAPWLGSPAAPIVQSLIWLRDGRYEFDDDVIDRLRKRASRQARAALGKNLHLLPGWALPAARRIADGAAG